MRPSRGWPSTRTVGSVPELRVGPRADQPQYAWSGWALVGSARSTAPPVRQATRSRYPREDQSPGIGGGVAEAWWAVTVWREALSSTVKP